MNYLKSFKDFKPFEIKEKTSIVGGYGDTGTTSHITTTLGTTGLSGYADPVYNDGTTGDWTDKDACR